MYKEGLAERTGTDRAAQDRLNSIRRHVAWGEAA